MKKLNYFNKYLFVEANQQKPDVFNGSIVKVVFENHLGYRIELGMSNEGFRIFNIDRKDEYTIGELLTYQISMLDESDKF
jgi:hypothetical protein